jgi:hypothetical protein
MTAVPQGYHESSELRDLVKTLITTIQESNQNVENYNKSMKIMTVVLIILTLVQVGGVLLK